jgi:hypothetical protein
MKRTIVRKSLRQTVADNQAALNFMSKLAGGDGHVNKVIMEPVKTRYPREPTVEPVKWRVSKEQMDSLNEANAQLNRIQADRIERGKRLGIPPILSEAQIQKSILVYLRLHPQVAWVGRFNSGAFIESYGGQDRYIQANSVKGCSDILGMLKGGRFFAIEVKSAKGRVTQNQDNFILRVLECGGYAGVARSIEDVNLILNFEV